MSVRKKTLPVWFVLSLVTPIYFFTMFYRLAPSVLAQDISVSLQLDLSGLASVSGITWISYGIMQLPSGLLADVFGGRKCLTGISLLACLGNICFAMSSGPGLAMIGRFILGFGCAALCPCCTVLAQNIRPEFYGKANSLFLALGLTGSIFAGIPLVMLSDALGWRVVIYGCAFVSFLTALVSWFFIPEDVSVHNANCMLGNFRLMARNAVEVMCCSDIWPYCIWMLLMLSAYFTISALWWVPYLKEVCELSSEAAGSIVSMVCFLMIPVQPIVITASDYFHTRTGIIRVTSIISLSATFVLIKFGPDMNTTGLVISWCGYLLATAYVSSVIYTAVKEIFPLRLAGTALGCLQTFPYVIGVPVMQSLFGKLVEWRTACSNTAEAFTFAMYFIALAVAGGVIVSFVMKEPRPAKNN